MTSRLMAAAALAVALMGGKLTAEPLVSGPQVGCDNDRRGFRPNFVAGPSAGQNLCPV
jgi:hypothetical protein